MEETVTPEAGQLSRNPSGFSAFLRKIRGAGAVADSAADAALAVPRCAEHRFCSPLLPGLPHADLQTLSCQRRKACGLAFIAFT